MYLARELAYNKKRGTFKVASECRLYINSIDTLSKQMSVYFFMTNTNKVRSDKMIQIYLRRLIT